MKKNLALSYAMESLSRVNAVLGEPLTNRKYRILDFERGEPLKDLAEQIQALQKYLELAEQGKIEATFEEMERAQKQCAELILDLNRQLSTGEKNLLWAPV